jgi:hypothetical protein
MTDIDKALVERLRWGGWYFDHPYDGNAYASDDPLEAADRIEAQAAEIERLRGHLEIWIFHNQRAMGQKPDDARAYAKAWMFRNAGGEEPE